MYVRRGSWETASTIKLKVASLLFHTVPHSLEWTVARRTLYLHHAYSHCIRGDTILLRSHTTEALTPLSHKTSGRSSTLPVIVILWSTRADRQPKWIWCDGRKRSAKRSSHISFFRRILAKGVDCSNGWEKERITRIHSGILPRRNRGPWSHELMEACLLDVTECPRQVSYVYR